MPDTQTPLQHIQPFIYATESCKSLHFSIGEIQSSMRLRDPDALCLEYTRLMMGFLLFHEKPQRITMIGLGGGSLAKFCHRHLLQARILVVEINPHVIALRDAFQIPPDDERLNVVCADGATYVRDDPPPCDVLMVDGFDLGGLPSPLCSQRFYDDCFEALRPAGIMVLNLHFDHPDYDAFLDRIGRSFQQNVLVVSDSDHNNSIVFARKGRDFQLDQAGPVRQPHALDGGAAGQLHRAFDRIKTALLHQRDAADGIAVRLPACTQP